MASTQHGSWAHMVGEALAEVFGRLPLEDRLKTVPLVCKGWRSASQDPICWREVDMEPWFEAKKEEWDWEENCEAEVEDFVRMIVDRSCGQLRRLKTMLCSNKAVEYIAKHCPNLRELSIKDSFQVGDKAALELARSCRRLEKLDLSDCYMISANSLQAFGRCCPSLISLSRNMVRSHEYSGVVLPAGDKDALAIGTHMPKLKHLELKKSFALTDLGLMHIAYRCQGLEVLNVACCTDLSPSALNKVSTICPKLTSLVKPIKPRMHVSPKFLCVIFD